MVKMGVFKLDVVKSEDRRVIMAQCVFNIRRLALRALVDLGCHSPFHIQVMELPGGFSEPKE